MWAHLNAWGNGSIFKLGSYALRLAQGLGGTPKHLVTSVKIRRSLAEVVEDSLKSVLSGSNLFVFIPYDLLRAFGVLNPMEI